MSASAGVAIAKLKDKIPGSKSDIARVMADLSFADKAARHAPLIIGRASAAKVRGPIADSTAA